MFIVIFNLRFLRSDLEDYILRETRYRFEQMTQGIENEYNQLFSISSQIFNNTLIGSLSQQPSYDNVFTAKNMLMNYVIANNFIEDIFFFDRRSEDILTSKTYVDFSFFFSHIYRVGGLAPEQVRTTLTQIRSNTYFGFDAVANTMENTAAAGAYLTSSALLGIANDNYFLGFILKKKSLDVLTSGQPDLAYRIYILSPQNVLLHHDDPDWKSTYLSILSVLELPEDNNAIDIGKDRYFFVKKTSPYSGLRYVLLIPQESYLRDLKRNETVFILSMVICVSVSSLIIFGITIYNYKPIKRLLAYTPEPPKGRGDELTLVEQTMRRISERNRRLVTSVEKSRVAVSERMVSLLLKNEIGWGPELSAFYDEFGIAHDCSYQVFVARPESTSDTKTVHPEAIIECFRSVMPKEPVVFGLESIVNSYFIFMMFYPPDGREIGGIDLHARIASFSSQVRSRWNMIVTIGMGRMYGSYSQIAKSYLEAVTCLDYSIIKGRSVLIDVAEIDEVHLPDTYPSEIFANIDRAFRHSDYRMLDERLNELKNSIFTNNYPIYMVRMIGYELISKVRSHVISRSSDASIEKDLFGHIESLFNLRSIENLFREIKSMVLEYRNHADGRNRTAARTAEMIEYLSIHYADPGLSATVMAEHFNMSRAGFSKYFKQHTGSTFVDYVSRLRIDASVDLLAHTDIPIKEIVHHIGYSDSSAFIRKFREHMGETPLSYRKNMQNVAG
jgi:AraC-like DNA-binding protein